MDENTPPRRTPLPWRVSLRTELALHALAVGVLAVAGHTAAVLVGPIG